MIEISDVDTDMPRLFIDVEEARLLEEKYITTIKTTPPEFVKALSPVQEVPPGGTAK